MPPRLPYRHSRRRLGPGFLIDVGLYVLICESGCGRLGSVDSEGVLGEISTVGGDQALRPGRSRSRSAMVAMEWVT